MGQGTCADEGGSVPFALISSRLQRQFDLGPLLCSSFDPSASGQGCLPLWQCPLTGPKQKDRKPHPPIVEKPKMKHTEMEECRTEGVEWA